ncbi:MAG TPA: hypothetical protein VD993_04950 [Chitinophagaceae bacterium]|nr:hypothetical protein [Chitinophagaceae bacterium]
MPTAALYKINSKGYLLHAIQKTTSGFNLASEPFIQITERNSNAQTIAEAIKTALKTDDSKKLPNPEDWEKEREGFLKKMGLKSIQELEGPGAFYCEISKENGNILFTPTIQAHNPDEGYVYIFSNDPDIVIPYTASDEEIAQTLQLVLSNGDRLSNSD